MSRRVLAIIGRPGSGKSAAVREFMRVIGVSWRLERLAPLLVGHAARGCRLTVLGDYSDETETFPGTDRLSMAAAPAALKWIREGEGDVLFEGDRLGSASTLRLIQLTPGVDLRVWCLEAPAHELVRRYMLRGSAQNARVLMARQTKVANICGNPNLRVEMVPNRDRHDQVLAVSGMVTYFTERLRLWQ